MSAAVKIVEPAPYVDITIGMGNHSVTKLRCFKNGRVQTVYAAQQSTHQNYREFIAAAEAMRQFAAPDIEEDQA